MNGVATVWSEFIGLFVDDIPFAGSILAWVIACKLLPRLALPPAVPPLMLFTGLATILVAAAALKTRKFLKEL